MVSRTDSTILEEIIQKYGKWTDGDDLVFAVKLFALIHKLI